MNSLLQKAIAILKSRTVITLIFMFAVNLLSVLGANLDPKLLDVLNAVLALLAGYFRIDPKQNFHK